MGGNTKKRVKKLLHHFRNLRTWQLILIIIPLLFVTATFLRLDHLKMAELKSAVLAADEADNEEQLSQAFTALRDFTRSHIVINIEDTNGEYQIYFGTGPFYLEHQYLRAANEALAQAEASGAENPNENIYAAASSVCQPQAIAHGWAWNSPAYLSCMTAEITKYPESPSTSAPSIPSTELFRYNFASPVWAPSLSGFAILICFLLMFAIIIRFFVWIILRIALIFLKKA